MTGTKHIAPLAVLRIAFGAVLLISTIRFIAKGWVDAFYVKPSFHFSFYGLEWVRVLPAAGMYIVFGVMLVAALFIVLGLFYRISVTAFLLSFTYVELIDKSYYLNHYYFVSVFTFLLLLAPAGRFFSLDVWRKPSIRIDVVPAWTIYMFQAQLCLVYFFAGISKLGSDWMLEAMPLRIWLPANTGLPVIGPLLGMTWVAYVFSWFGAVFDLSIGPLLLWRRSRKIAYAIVILFHMVTALLFKIGMFPYIMMAATVIFFSEGWHRRVLSAMGARMSAVSARMSASAEGGNKAEDGVRTADGGVRAQVSAVSGMSARVSAVSAKMSAWVLGVFFGLQVLIPLRYLLYPGRLFWTEEGYRFSWRVMLMEKSGTDFFFVRDPVTGRRGEVDNAQFLTPLQERQMSTQPDMILQYAHYLHDVYRTKTAGANGADANEAGTNRVNATGGNPPGMGPDPVVTVASYVTLNGSGSRLYIDSTVDLAKQPENFYHKTWILPFIKNK